MTNLLERYSENGTDNQNEEQTIEELENTVLAQEEAIVDLLQADRPGQEMVSSNENLGREILVGLGVIVVINVILGVISAIISLLFGGNGSSEKATYEKIKKSNERIRKINEDLARDEARRRAEEPRLWEDLRDELDKQAKKDSASFSAKDKKGEINWSRLQEDVVLYKKSNYLKCFFECEDLIFGDLLEELGKTSDFVKEVHKRGVSKKRIIDLEGQRTKIERLEDKVIKTFPNAGEDLFETVNLARDQVIRNQNEALRSGIDLQKFMKEMPDSGISNGLKKSGIKIGSPSEKKNERLLKDIEKMLAATKKQGDVGVGDKNLSEEEQKELLKQASEAEQALLKKARDVLKAIALICQARAKLLNIEQTIKDGFKQYNPDEKTVN